MKTIKHISVALIMFMAITITAQQSINYKALIKDGSGNVVANDLIQVQFSILQGVAQTNVYQETHTPTTDANGMVILNIGEGTTSDVFTAIDWASDDHFLNVQINTGNGLTDMGTTQFMAVPYALSAKNVENSIWSKNGNDIYRTSSNVGIGTSTPSTKFQIVGGTDASLTDGSGYLVLGDEFGLNVVIDENEIIARGNGAVSTLYLQKDGGDVWIGGNGSNVGINGTPTSKLHVFQNSQSVGTGLAFTDNTVNQDWNVTHGFALRFHYGATLKGFINANTGAYTTGSDVNLKSNIQNMNTTLNRIKQLRPTTYFYKDDTKNKKALGFIAQEVESIFPEVVHFSEADGLYGIDYASFGVIAIKAIQEQQTIIENQQKQIDELKALVKAKLKEQ